MKAQKTTNKGAETSELDKLYKTAIAARKRMREFEEEFAAELEEYKVMQDTLAGLQERIKIEARKMARQGSTRVLIDNENIHVSVAGKQTRTFDIPAVKKLW
jgi:hypothetical protein